MLEITDSNHPSRTKTESNKRRSTMWTQDRSLSVHKALSSTYRFQFSRGIRSRSPQGRHTKGLYSLLLAILALKTKAVLCTITLRIFVVPTLSVWQVILFRVTGVVHRIIYSFNYFFFLLVLFTQFILDIK